MKNLFIKFNLLVILLIFITKCKYKKCLINNITPNMEKINCNKEINFNDKNNSLYTRDF